MLTWDELCSRNAFDKELHQKIASARAVFDHDEKLEGGDQTLNQVCQIGVEVERNFLVASEREMRADTSLARIPRMSLRGLPTVKLPSEASAGAEPEELYIFKDPADSLRRMRVKMFFGHQLKQERTQPNQVLYANQPSDMLSHCVQTDGNTKTLIDLMHKASKLVDYEDFTAELAQPEEQDAEEDDADCAGEALAGGDGSLVGPGAAHFMQPPPEVRTPTSGQKSKLARGSSRDSFWNGAAGSDAGSHVTVESSAAEGDDDDGGALSGVGQCPFCV